MLIIYGWTRGIHFVYLVVRALIGWYQDRAWCFLIGGTLFFVTYTLSVNAPMMVTFERYMKFRNASAEYEALPMDTPKKQKRASMVILENVAREFAESIDPAVDHLAVLMESFQEEESKFERRQTTTLRQKLVSMRSSSTWMGSTPPCAWKVE